MKTYKDFLNESSLSRILKQIEYHDCGMLTAFRTYKTCPTQGNEEPEKYTLNENKKRNRQLLAKINLAGYGYTKVAGGYIEYFQTEYANEIQEDVFFVVDLKDRGNLKNDLKEWGEHYNQDSILFIPKININKNGKIAAELIGTNDCENSYPGYGEIISYNNISFGKENTFLTRVNNRPFFLKESFYNSYIQKFDGNMFNGMAMQSLINEKI